MAPGRKGRGERKRKGKSEKAPDRLLTAAAAERLATKLGFSEKGRDVLDRFTKRGVFPRVMRLLDPAESECLADELGISGKARDAFHPWLRREMVTYQLAEEHWLDPTVDHVLKKLPLLEKRLRHVERLFASYDFGAAMLVHKLAAVPKGLGSQETPAAIERAVQRVTSEVRAVSSLVARAQAMVRRDEELPSGRGASHKRTKSRPHDHILAERMLAFWDQELRDQGVLQDDFCHLALGLVGVRLTSIGRFVNEARDVLYGRRASTVMLVALRGDYVADLYRLADEAPVEASKKGPGPAEPDRKTILHLIGETRLPKR